MAGKRWKKLTDEVKVVRKECLVAMGGKLWEVEGKLLCLLWKIISS